MNANTAPEPGWATFREARAVITNPRTLRRTVTIALIVGSIFFTMNQLGIVLAGRATTVVWLKVVLTYLTPLIVSNIGVLSATRRIPYPPAEEPRIKRAGRRAARAVVVAAVLAVAVAVPAMAKQGSVAAVYWFEDGSQVVDARSRLATTDQGAKMTLQTSELPAGHTVTVWWVIFNEPTNCTHPEGSLRCGPGDLPPFGGDDSAVTSVVYAAGHVIGGSGKATFSDSLAKGDASDALFGPGLVNPTRADIHLVVRDHGLLTPQQRAEGIHNFGPCNPCADIQFSPHEQ